MHGRLSWLWKALISCSCPPLLSLQGVLYFCPVSPLGNPEQGKGGKLNSSFFSASKRLLFTLGPTRQQVRMNRREGSRPWSLHPFVMHPGKWGTRGVNARPLPISAGSSTPDSQLCPKQNWRQEAKRREHKRSHKQELGTKCPT